MGIKHFIRFAWCIWKSSRKTMVKITFQEVLFQMKLTKMFKKSDLDYSALGLKQAEVLHGAMDLQIYSTVLKI